VNIGGRQGTGASGGPWRKAGQGRKTWVREKARNKLNAEGKELGLAFRGDGTNLEERAVSSIVGKKV